MCDLAIAGDNAIFGQVGPQVGSFDAGFGIGLLARLVGEKKAKEIWFLCHRYSAAEALEMGLVNRVVPLAELEAATLKYARRMALISPEALAATKLAINRGADIAGLRGALRAGLDVLAPLYAARTEVGMKFDEIREKDGLGAALRWRAAQLAGQRRVSFLQSRSQVAH